MAGCLLQLVPVPLLLTVRAGGGAAARGPGRGYEATPSRLAPSKGPPLRRSRWADGVGGGGGGGGAAPRRGTAVVAGPPGLELDLLGQNLKVVKKFGSNYHSCTSEFGWFGKSLFSSLGIYFPLEQQSHPTLNS